MKKNTVKKVALDLYIEQMKWSVWFIGIVMAVYIVTKIVGNFYDFDFIENLLVFSASSSMIYMFVIGIIGGATFLPKLVKLGVTRTHFFYGTVVAAMLKSISLSLIFSLFTVLGFLFSVLFDFNVADSVFNNFPASIFLYSLNIFLSYILGWLINVGYYKFHWIIGLFFIALAVGLNSIYALIWETSIVTLFSLNIDLFDNNIEAAVAQSSGLSFLLSLLASLAIISVVLIIIRTLTRKISIKIK